MINVARSFIGLAALAGTMLTTPGQAAPAAQCGDSFIGGPSTMPTIVRTWPVMEGAAPACAINVTWLTYWAGVPVLAGSGIMTMPTDIAGKTTALQLRPVGAGWPTDMQAAPSEPIAEAVIRFTDRPAVVVGLGAYDLRPAEIRRFQMPDWSSVLVVQESTAGGEEAAEPWILRPMAPAVEAGEGYQIGIVNRDRGIVNFYRPALTGDPQQVSILPLTDLTTVP